MMHGGATYEEACEAVIKGCYEYAVKADSIPISYNMINALKPIVLVFHNGRDPRTGLMLGCETGDVTSFIDFAQFYNAYRAQLACVIDKTMVWVERLERHVHKVNPALFYSGTVPRCVESLTDAMDGGVHNVTDMWFSGFGSAVDALMAVYELVFETGVTTLAALKEALDRNWEGYEPLRLRALACRHKYGRGDSMADAYACALHRFFSSRFVGKKNCHGGNIEYELHSARAYLAMGDATEATPDGRRTGEETSKNASPSNGADSAGVTALIRSATSLDLSLADSGACLDCMLHPSALQGEGGLDVLYGVLRTYHDRGGASIHFNIFSADMLRDAQQHPEKYQALQVRVCGWNVLWNNLEKREQDAFIKRAEGIAP
jgi:formate C-acetyltransferase